jgi:hypothetical protein
LVEVVIIIVVDVHGGVHLLDLDLDLDLAWG